MKHVEGHRFPNEKGRTMQVSDRAAGGGNPRRLRGGTEAGDAAAPGGRPRKALPQAGQPAPAAPEHRAQRTNRLKKRTILGVGVAGRKNCRNIITAR